MKELSLFLIFFLPLNLKAEFYQTSALARNPQTSLTWKDMGLSLPLLNEAVQALTGERFPERPEEWDDYFLNTQFEDEDSICLNDPEKWRLVALRALPLAAGPEHPQPELRLTFQPYCSPMKPEVSSDSSLQVLLRGSEKTFSPGIWQLIPSRKKTASLRFEDAGFIRPSPLALSHESPGDLSPGVLQNVKKLIQNGYVPQKVQWMASTHGQLDWIFGRLHLENGTWISEDLLIKDQKGQTLLSLGEYDFLPLVLREPYLQLSPQKKIELSPYITTEDLHQDLSTAKKVLNIDQTVSDAFKTSHHHTSCIQCHSAQERMERATNFINYGGALEFGYFFRGLGHIADRPYVSWRSVQESKYWDQKIRVYLNQ